MSMYVNARVDESEVAYALQYNPEAAFQFVARLSEYIADTQWEDRIIEMFKEDR